jgi:FkbM family methyltransferase
MITRRGPAVPWLTFRYLHRDGDDRTWPWLVGRELRECAADMRRSARYPLRDRPRLAFWAAAYHAGMFAHPMASRRVGHAWVTVGGRRLKVRFRRNQSDLYILRENFLYEIYDFAYESRLGSVATVVDLGANIGLSGLWFQGRFPGARLVCVEPVAENVELLRENARVNGLGWAVEQAAVAASTGPVTLYPNEWWSSSSTTREVSDARTGSRTRLERLLQLPTTQVHGWSVADLMARHGLDAIDVLKVDVEGAEADVFAGDTPWLESVRLVVMEVHRKYVDPAPIVAHLASHGLRLVPGRRGPCDVFSRDPSVRRRMR